MALLRISWDFLFSGTRRQYGMNTYGMKKLSTSITQHRLGFQASFLPLLASFKIRSGPRPRPLMNYNALRTPIYNLRRGVAGAIR